jgi:hypothetical protein
VKYNVFESLEIYAKNRWYYTIKNLFVQFSYSILLLEQPCEVGCNTLNTKEREINTDICQWELLESSRLECRKVEKANWNL